MATANPSVNIVTTGSPYWVVLKIAMPTVLAMLTQSTVNQIDIWFFGQLPSPESTNAQAALSPALVLFWLFGGSLSAISVGTQAITARRFAEGDPDKAGGVVLNSWFFGLCAGIAFTAVCYFTLPYTMPLIVKVPAVQEAAVDFMQWRLLAIASMVMSFSFKAFFDGLGKTHVHMIAAIVMNIFNAIFCYMYIFGNWGAPRMGMAGAGVAALLATFIGLALMMFWAGLPKYRKPFRPFALSKLDKSVTWAILKLSIPSAVATLAVMTGFVLFMFIVSKLDALEVAKLGDAATGDEEPVNSAATTVIVGVLQMTFTACLAFGTSTATLVSQSLGERDADKAERFGWVSIRLGLLIFGLVGLLEGIVFPREIIAFFNDSPAVIEAGLLPMQMMGSCTPIIAVGMIFTQALFGAGNSRFVMIVELILHFTCLVPLAWLFGITFDWGLPGIWSAGVIYAVALAAVMTWKFNSGDWKAIKL